MSRADESVALFQPFFNFTVKKLMDCYVSILSVVNDKLLISDSGLSQLFIYNCEGRHLSTITINDNELLFDAMWTPRGNIVYTTFSNTVVVISESGEVITPPTQMTFPGYLSVSNDNIIYLADRMTDVYQSTNDGVSWSIIFQSTDGWHCWQAIKVNTDHRDEFWTLEKSNNNNYHLRVYGVNRKHYDVTWKDIIITTTNDKHCNLAGSRLSYDNNMNIFLSDYYNKAVHVLSVNGQYHCQLLSSQHFKNYPCALAVDRKSELLYVGQNEGVVGVFKLTYGNGGN